MSIFLLVYLIFTLGLLSFQIAPRRRADRITLLFDIATVALSGVMIFWYWSLRTGVFDLTTTVGNQGYRHRLSVGRSRGAAHRRDSLVRSADNRSRSIFGFMALGYLCSSIADFWYGYLQQGVAYQRNTAIDLCWFAAVLFPIFAAKAQLQHLGRAGDA